jgi:hypothetical protein
MHFFLISIVLVNLGAAGLAQYLARPTWLIYTHVGIGAVFALATLASGLTTIRQHDRFWGFLFESDKGALLAALCGSGAAALLAYWLTQDLFEVIVASVVAFVLVMRDYIKRMIKIIQSRRL